MKTKILTPEHEVKKGVIPGRIYDGPFPYGAVLALGMNNFSDDDFEAIRKGKRVLLADLESGRLLYGNPEIVRTELRPVGGTLQLEKV
jgi:hypothetical protein